MILTALNVQFLVHETLPSSTAQLRRAGNDNDGCGRELIRSTILRPPLQHVAHEPFSPLPLPAPLGLRRLCESHVPGIAPRESKDTIERAFETRSANNAEESSSGAAVVAPPTEQSESDATARSVASNGTLESNGVRNVPLEAQMNPPIDAESSVSVVSIPQGDVETIRTDIMEAPPTEPLLNTTSSESRAIRAKPADSATSLHNDNNNSTQPQSMNEPMEPIETNNDAQWNEPLESPSGTPLHPESSDLTVESSRGQINVLPRPMLRLMDLDRYLKFPHRGGWTSIINGLNASEYLSLSPASAEEVPSVGLVDFVESWFLWDNRGAIEQQPWVGFAHLMLHSALPSHLQDSDHNGVLDFTFETETFRRSAPQCVALMVFTTAMAVQTSQKLGELGLDHIPVCVVTHPMGVESNVATYDPTVDLAAALSITSSIVLLGQQYRRIASLHQLQTQRSKVWLPSFSDPHWLRIKTDMELKAENVTMDDTVEIRRLESNDDYDMFVRQNIVIVDLWAAGANNAVMESLALQAPFLIRKLDGPVEYLGEDYPLFFSHLDEVQYWLDNEDVLREKMLEAHRYLQQLDTSGYTIEHFGEQMVNCTMAAMNGFSMRRSEE
jgi:hypothetical protein